MACAGRWPAKALNAAAWQSELARRVPPRVVANMAWPCVPVIQGWRADDYLRSLDLLMQVWERWQPWVAPPALIGIGSVCRRSLHHPTHGLYAILRALDGRLPAGAKAHLFGVKGAGLAKFKSIPWVASADSMAYDFTERVNAHRRGDSNTMEGRARHDAVDGQGWVHDPASWWPAAAAGPVMPWAFPVGNGSPKVCAIRAMRVSSWQRVEQSSEHDFHRFTLA